MLFATTTPFITLVSLQDCKMMITTVSVCLSEKHHYNTLLAKLKFYIKCSKYICTFCPLCWLRWTYISCTYAFNMQSIMIDMFFTSYINDRFLSLVKAKSPRCVDKIKYNKAIKLIYNAIQYQTIPSFVLKQIQFVWSHDHTQHFTWHWTT